MTTQKTNKEVIQSLTEYFCNQAPEVVAKCLAAMMIDMNRLYHITTLDVHERTSLLDRMEHNMKELRKFVKGEEAGEMKLSTINSDS